MGFIFDQRAAEHQEAWFKTEAGRAAFSLQTGLVLRLIKPKPQERMLDVGCGTGLYLEIFKENELNVTGLEPSPAMLRIARKRLGHRATLVPGRAEDLPFEDNEFDIVTLITSLEFTEDPESALAEAMRVAQSRVFIGVLNGFSITAMTRRVKGLVKESIYNRARFFSLWQLLGMMSRLTDPTRIRWGTVHLLPTSLTHRVMPFESLPLVQSNPFGAFLGLVADVTYSMRTDNLPVRVELKLKGRPVPTPTTYGSAKFIDSFRFKNHEKRIGNAGSSAL
ncbi:MAG: class I SAM-dependent methyltransferase [Deltaproteobacteria bacterium]|nr:class I SAM-dependent methyltransferase [Deltaproteobacteria bacterium]MBW2053516.1 class I SAM-dependent methyltransferase [Deltaproteobacteria bacterium]MBW2140805.1 class I SAM-dependent methyltransferase [Deltaproteobacteria bacterium]MBW2323926.1 class I SAM-dependent methyltransferase [Deltaproteobacteria bacterium]